MTRQWLLPAPDDNPAMLGMFRDDAQALGPPLTRGQWTQFEITFDAGAGTYTVKRNGMLARSGNYPAALAAHLGALVLGGASGSVHGYYTDLVISQP